MYTTEDFSLPHYGDIIASSWMNASARRQLSQID
jgi:hypothetical protein